MIQLDKFWAGNADSYNIAVAGVERGVVLKAETYGDSSPELPPIWGKRGNLAVIEIQGSLVTGSSGYGRFFGVLGYDDIQEALVEAVTDPEVKSVLLNINSGGGAVTGADDLAEFIAKVDKVKPVTAYTNGMMASAAYWIGSSARHIMANQTAMLGSIGVLMVHMERSAQLKEAGIGVTLVRAGKYKALANSLEPLSEDALAELESHAADLYGIFIKRIAANMDITVAEADTKVGQGRVFLGKAAQQVKLADKIGTYEQAVAYAEKLDNGKQSSNNLGKKGTNMKASLTEQQLAALAAGATMESVQADAAAAAPAGEAPAADADAGSEAGAQAAVEGAEAAAAATETPAAEAKVEDTGALAVLKEQLGTTNEQLVSAKVELATVKAELAAATASATANATLMAGLLGIAKEATAKMTVALGGSAEKFATMDAQSIIAEHASVSSNFVSKFKVGGVTAASTPAESTKPAPVVSPVFTAMVKAANSVSK